MNKYIYTFCLLLQSLILYGQTYYYQLSKKIVNNVTYTNMAGGQFITFKGDRCYDSDRYGNSVENGELKLNESLSDNILIYIGPSYFGSTTSYRFNKDKSLLNVYTANGRIYVYKRSTPPSGINTCSLIKDKHQQPNTYPMPPLPIYIPDPMPLPPYPPNITEQDPIPDPKPDPYPSVESHLTAAQYQSIYNGYEDVVKSVFRAFEICPDMNYGPRVQNMQTLRDAQKSMRSTRQEAARYGITIQQSYYETATPH